MSLPQQPNVQLGAVNESAPANPWAAFSQAINTGLQTRKQNFENDQDRQYLLQQRKAQQQQLDMQTAQGKLNMLKPILLSDPQKAADPQYQQTVQDIYKTLGLPAPVNQDGSIDVNQFKTPWTGVDERMSQFILQLPKEQRKSLLDRYSGVPKDAYTTDAFISAKDQASLQRAMTGIKSEEDRTAIETKRTQISAERAQAYETGNYARVGEIDALTGKYKAETSRVTEETREMPLKLAQAQQRINDTLQRTKLISQRGGGGAFQLTRLLNSEATNAARLFTEADNAYKSQLQAYQAALGNGVDPESPEMTAAKQQLDDTSARRDQLKTTYDNAQNYLSGEAAALATGSHVSSGTGNPTTVVGGAGASKPLGKAPQGLSPGTYEVRGQKVEVRADGNYYAI